MLLKLSDESNDIGFTPAVIISQAKCVGCALCAGMCPDLAIKVFSRQKNEYTGNMGRSFMLYTSIVSVPAG
jgi:Fe-S-cluster-containing hydrogenase component 2